MTELEGLARIALSSHYRRLSPILPRRSNPAETVMPAVPGGLVAMRYAVNGLLLFAVISGIWPHGARAQTLAEREAAKETEIDGLRLLDGQVQEPRLAALGVHLGYVPKDTRPGGGKYFCGALSPDRSSAAASHVATALSRLPDAPLRKLRLRYVVLCGGATAGGQRIGGIPVPPLDLLMLDVGQKSGDGPYLQHGFLHELYHLIEFRFNTYQDAEWQHLFGAGYANSYAGRLEGPPVGGARRGFLNTYAETYPHEDRAELFATLLLNPADVVAHIRTTRDDVLTQKIVYLDRKSQRLLGLRIAPAGF